jgi:hypothetical protein
VVALPAADIGHVDLEAREDNQTIKKGGNLVLNWY